MKGKDAHSSSSKLSYLIKVKIEPRGAIELLLTANEKRIQIVTILFIHIILKCKARIKQQCNNKRVGVQQECRVLPVDLIF